MIQFCPRFLGTKQAPIRLFSAFSGWRAEVSRCSAALGFNGTIFVWPGAQQMEGGFGSCLPNACATPLHNEGGGRDGRDIFWDNLNVSTQS